MLCSEMRRFWINNFDQTNRYLLPILMWSPHTTNRWHFGWVGLLALTLFFWDFEQSIVDLYISLTRALTRNRNFSICGRISKFPLQTQLMESISSWKTFKTKAFHRTFTLREGQSILLTQFTFQSRWLSCENTATRWRRRQRRLRQRWWKIKQLVSPQIKK